MYHEYHTRSVVILRRMSRIPGVHSSRLTDPITSSNSTDRKMQFSDDFTVAKRLVCIFAATPRLSTFYFVPGVDVRSARTND